MRVVRYLLIAAVFATTAPQAGADPLQAEFTARIEAALAHPGEAARGEAVARLFHHDPADAGWAVELIPRVIRHIVRLADRRISFAPLSPETELVHIVDGYEYRPNLEPLGQVVFSNPARPGNDTKVLYGRHPREARLYFPLTTRRW